MSKLKLHLRYIEGLTDIRMICANLNELMTQRNLRLEALFWGYRELLMKFTRTCLPLLRECHLQETRCFGYGGNANIYEVLDGTKICALKVPCSNLDACLVELSFNLARASLSDNLHSAARGSMMYVCKPSFVMRPCCRSMEYLTTSMMGTKLNTGVNTTVYVLLTP